ncbi:hypothetical protein [Oligoflexus tunisiensis]|uniref:hypothetical protein n=1 Tax=Oligoflexus tunisiensis TaxID=708132 RepID=UPI00114CCBFA|nr:hypothetical protein [Oligoflexus tunisiensis]
MVRVKWEKVTKFAERFGKKIAPFVGFFFMALGIYLGIKKDERETFEYEKADMVVSRVISLKSQLYAYYEAVKFFQVERRMSRHH